MCDPELLCHTSWNNRESDESLVDRLRSVGVDWIMGTILNLSREKEEIFFLIPDEGARIGEDF